MKSCTSCFWLLLFGYLFLASVQANPSTDSRVQEELAKRLPGFVYKTPQFWMGFHNLDAGRLAFEGKSEGLESLSMFRKNYTALNYAFSNVCGDELPSDKITKIVTFQTVYTDGRGGERYRDPAQSFTFSFDPRFYGKVVEYEQSIELKQSSQTVMRSVEEMYDRGKARMAKSGATLSSFFQGMFDDFNAETDILSMTKLLNKVGCSSPTMFQLRENMRRVAYGLPTLQQARLPIADAARDTEPAEWIVTKPTIYESCQRQVSSMADLTPRSLAYCACMENEAAIMLTDTELSDIVENYDELRRAVDNHATTPVSATNVAWRLQAVRNQCFEVLDGKNYRSRAQYYSSVGEVRFAAISKQVETAKQQRIVDLAEREEQLSGQSDDRMDTLRQQTGMQIDNEGYLFRVISEGQGIPPTGAQKVALRVHGVTVGGKIIVLDSRKLVGLVGGKDDVAHLALAGIRHLKALHSALLRMKPGDKWEVYAPPGLGEPTHPNEIIRYDVELLQVL